jgi:hypothetical protein
VDDLFIVPLGIVLAIKLIPAEIMAEHRRRTAREQVQPQSRAGAVAAIVVWIIVSIQARAPMFTVSWWSNSRILPTPAKIGRRAQQTADAATF